MINEDTKNLFIASAKLRFFNPIFRPLVQYLISDLRTTWYCNRRAAKLIAPIIEERLLLEKKAPADYKKPVDSIEWLRDLVPEEDKNDAHLHAIFQLAIASVSVGSTSHLLTNVIFNLATWPEYVPLLRQEIEDVFAEAGGEWTLDSMGQLKKLDSFMKESLRFNGHVTSKFKLRISGVFIDKTKQPLSNDLHVKMLIFPTEHVFLPALWYSHQQMPLTSTRIYTLNQARSTVCDTIICAKSHRRTRKVTNL